MKIKYLKSNLIVYLNKYNMGVPGFFLWLMTNYKKEGFIFQKEKLTITDINELLNSKKKPEPDKIEKIIKLNEYNQMISNEINSMDWFLIDANCLIHPVCFKTVAENPDLTDNEKLESKMIKNVLEYLNKLIDYVDPKKGVYLAIDGVAPVAKIKQQRSRRFKSVADKILWDKIKTKHSKPLSNYWNNNAVTPGTVFMVKLHQSLLAWAKQSQRKIIYSSCFTPAEGEHKLLQFIRKNQKDQDSKLNDMSYVIYGLDADLIFLALSTESNKIYLLREANEINKNESKEVLNYVSIKIMKKSIVNTIKSYLLECADGLLNVDKMDVDSTKKNENLYGFDNLDESRIVNDFIFMCYLLGNDFLPHIPSLDIHQDGIENLIIEYSETLNELIIENNKIDYLLKDKNALQGNSLNKVNTDFLSRFINKLASKEEGILRENFAKGKRRMTCDGGEYEKEMFRIENLQFKINDPIQLGSDTPDEWRLRYYNHYWGVQKDDLEDFSQTLVKHYLIGIKWVTQYYFDDCPSWEWYFPFDHPPFISDIAKYIDKININKMKFELGKPIKPFMQLLAVLPPQSNYLLPVSLRKLVLNHKSSLAFMYPQEFEQDFINKKKYWMAIPKLPPLDIELIKYYYFKYKDELKEDENERNNFKKYFEF
jgi:5'-3' exonuclease